MMISPEDVLRPFMWPARVSCPALSQTKGCSEDVFKCPIVRV